MLQPSVLTPLLQSCAALSSTLVTTWYSPDTHFLKLGEGHAFQLKECLLEANSQTFREALCRPHCKGLS